MAEITHIHLFANTTLRSKLIVLVSGIVSLCVIPLSTIVYFKNKGIILEKTYEVCRTIANNIAKIADDELLVGDTFEATNSALTKLKDVQVKALVETLVLDLDGKIVARLNSENNGIGVTKENLEYFSNLQELTSRERKQGELSLLEFAYPIFIKYQNKNIRIGTAVFDFNAKVIFEPIDELRNYIFYITAVLFLLGVGIAFFLSNTISSPLQILNEGANRFGGGDFNHRIMLTGRDEIGQLAMAFNTMGVKIQDFTNNLEQKVLERTDELNHSLEEVNALKVAQDGDYYLTALLLEPLSTNNNYSSHVKTEFIMEQKKKFTFRKWESQIGGDICITDTIKLYGKDYTVFLNADAMGKSIQGAGGALVLGVVFNAGLIRSRISAQTHIFPETWLKERFLDLQNVFLSFDGTMYISVCIGLVENESGIMYYINAEHPGSVLYRDGKASFLEETDLPKIGTPGQESRFSVKTFQLMKGDIIITGSDGRDDIIIGHEDGNDIMNEDQSLFLKSIEEGQGNLPTIAERIKKRGSLYDDFSLLRISYFENSHDDHPESIASEKGIRSSLEKGKILLDEGKAEKALSLLTKILSDNKPFPEILKLIAQGYVETKQWEKAIECYRQYSNLCPMENEIIFKLSKAFYEFGKKTEAADYGERFLLREPKHLLNLIHLAKVHMELGIPARARSVIDKAAQIDSENSSVKEILTQLNQMEESFTAEGENDFGEISRQSPERQKIECIIIAARLYHMNRFKEALPYFVKALSFDPRDPSTLFNLGNVYYKLGDFAKAKKEWERTLAIKPDFIAVKEKLNKLDQNKKTKGNAA